MSRTSVCLRRIPLFLVALLSSLPAPARAQAPPREQIENWVSAHHRPIVTELLDLLAIPNIAADRDAIQRNAVHLQGMLRARGFVTELLETPGNPLVWGELKAPGARRTILFYAHYDGQPVNRAAWSQQDPFTPILRSARIDQGGTEMPDLRTRDHFDPDWRLYGRSTADDKSPIVALLSALDAVKSLGLQPTSNLRIVLDGEEENSSPSLVPAIEKYGEKFAADLMLVFDGPAHFDGSPTVVFGARGIQTLTLTVFGPKVGVHSGNYGNWVPNPALRLAHLLASMKDDAGRVVVKGFYDDLQPLAPEEQAMLDGVPREDARLLKTFGIAEPELPGRSLQEAVQVPTLNIRGLQSAFIGDQARTIIPDRAVAEIDIRLVKETSGERMLERVIAHVREQGYHVVAQDPDDETRAKYPRIAKITSPRAAATAAFRTSPLLPESKLVVDAVTRMWGAPPVRIRTLGGTVPIAQFIDALGFPAILVPIVNFDNNQHEENENLRLGHLFRGIVTYAALLTM